MNLKSLALILFLLAPLAVPSALAEGGTITVAMDAPTYSAQETLTTSPPRATIQVLDAEGAPLAGVEVRVIFLRQVQFVGFVSNETVSATTGIDGTVTVTAPQASSLPGTYLVAVVALDTIGSARYTIEV